MRRNLVLLSLVAGMGVQALDWYAVRQAPMGRTVESKGVYGVKDGAFTFPWGKPGTALKDGAFTFPWGKPSNAAR
jgi:hypothetical protein